MNSADLLVLQKLLDRPRAYKYGVSIGNSPSRRGMILLTSDYPNSFSSNRNSNKFKENRKYKNNGTIF